MLPGDRLIMVVDGKAVAGDAAPCRATAPAEKAPWYDGLMQSVGGRRRRGGTARRRPGPVSEPISPADREIVARQLGRPPRALVGVAHRCPCGQPDVVETSPRLEDGTPFPTLYYLTCPRATAAASRWSRPAGCASGRTSWPTDPELAAAYLAAHEAYLATRDATRRAARPGGPPAACPTGSSACTRWPGTRWPPGRA